MGQIALSSLPLFLFFFPRKFLWLSEKRYLCSQRVLSSKMKNVKMEKEQILERLKNTAKQILPYGGQVWLYGSRARGDAHEDSDWDLLILLDKQTITQEDEDEIAYPLVVEGWRNDSAVSPQIYTFGEWEARSFTPYYQQIERDKQRIL